MSTTLPVAPNGHFWKFRESRGTVTIELRKRVFWFWSIPVRGGSFSTPGATIANSLEMLAWMAERILKNRSISPMDVYEDEEN